LVCEAPQHSAPARPHRPYLQARQWRLWLSGLLGSRYDGLEHFAVVQPGVLMRCGQPRVRDLERVRQQHGLRTIVCARGGTRHPLRGHWFRLERRYCREAGIEFHHIPFDDRSRFSTEILDRFVALAATPARWPLLVHCEQGFHRTGVLCAAYRIAIEGWSRERAMLEMQALGFNLEDRRRRGLIDALRAWRPQRGAPETGAAAHCTAQSSPK
jgi:uncharacterized protein (TIGR01244 family)